MNKLLVLDGKYVEFDSMGDYITYGNKKDIDKMIKPVICTYCSKPYDLTAVKPIHRFADCTTYKTPCCKKHADDRRWKSLPDFVVLGKSILVN